MCSCLTDFLLVVEYLNDTEKKLASLTSSNLFLAK